MSKMGSLMIDPAKIAGIKDWPTTLKNIKEVRSTLGLLGYPLSLDPELLKDRQNPLQILLGKGPRVRMGSSL